MKTNILNYINKLQGYKTAIKNLHWSSKTMSEHKLLDEIADSVANNQDEIAEMCQGIYGKFKLNELKSKRYNIINSKKMLHDMLRDTKSFYSSIKGRELTGVRSVVETFIGDINKFIYLMEMCIKEDIKRNLIASTLNEKIIKLNDNELRGIIKEAINNTLFDNINTSKDMNIDEFKEFIINSMEAQKQDIINDINKINQKSIETFNILKDFIKKFDSIADISTAKFSYSEKITEVYIKLKQSNLTDDELEYLEEYVDSITHGVKGLFLYARVSLDYNNSKNGNNTYYLTITLEDSIPYMYLKYKNNDYSF
jgi:DNA-binding ferritin-like protein